ncbi:hypothetical protein [Pimelobacter simplex]|uniref:hypothetical protein n=1 Tax=Nocardioides simplex TaxID=2045 RepID=UPI00214FA00D|nr:hypothetical protein [Pimelobacter simplex]UUW88348.1 hypothetical protein M0M43_21750 [Pimelobacter simplex]UUW97852.1 hypothetical protein M0M48_10395 [Pimelobacter simplex]
MMEGMGLFAAAGIRIVPVEDFAPGAVLVSEFKILLVDTDLTTEERHRVACEFLPAAIALGRPSS